MDLQCLLAAPPFPTFPVPRDRPALADLQLSCPSSAGLLSLPREPPWSDFLSAAISGEAPCDLMPSPAELWLQCQKGGSNTPAFDELPLSLLHWVSWGSWGVLADWLHGIFRGEPSYYLNGALHLCLRKKEPSWLLRNSRPFALPFCYCFVGVFSPGMALWLDVRALGSCYNGLIGSLRSYQW